MLQFAPIFSWHQSVFDPFQGSWCTSLIRLVQQIRTVHFLLCSLARHTFWSAWKFGLWVLKDICIPTPWTSYQIPASCDLRLKPTARKAFIFYLWNHEAGHFQEKSRFQRRAAGWGQSIRDKRNRTNDLRVQMPRYWRLDPRKSTLTRKYWEIK